MTIEAGKVVSRIRTVIDFRKRAKMPADLSCCVCVSFAFIMAASGREATLWVDSYCFLRKSLVVNVFLCPHEPISDSFTLLTVRGGSGDYSVMRGHC